MTGIPSLWPSKKALNIPDSAQHVTESIAKPQVKARLHSNLQEIDVQYSASRSSWSQSVHKSGAIPLEATQVEKFDKDMMRNNISRLDYKFEAFTNAVASVCSILNETEAYSFEEHLITWTSYYGKVKHVAEFKLICIESMVDTESKFGQAQSQADCYISACSNKPCNLDCAVETEVTCQDSKITIVSNHIVC